jgi:pimeloyl-ACP methyl ester carboxylesterase
LSIRGDLMNQLAPQARATTVDSVLGDATRERSGANATRHRAVDVDGIEVFYREVGDPDALLLLLPHGYPGSSFVYRHLVSALGDRWRLVAPDLPGFGYSATPSPEEFGYTFDAYTRFLQRFVEVLGPDRYVLWLHDYGSQFGLRLAMHDPDRVAGPIIQNVDIYEDEFGPKYDGLRELWANPGPVDPALVVDVEPGAGGQPRSSARRPTQHAGLVPAPAGLPA